MSAKSERELPPPLYKLYGTQYIELPSFDPEREYQEYTELINRAQIMARVRGMAEELKEAYEGQRPPILAILTNGGMGFGVDLMREMAKLNFHVPAQAFYGSRYDEDEKPVNGDFISFEPPVSRTKIAPFAGKERTLIIIDDITDGAVTIEKAERHFELYGFKRIETAVLFDKPGSARNPGLEDYMPTRSGFLVPNVWYGGGFMDTTISDPTMLEGSDYSHEVDRHGLGRGWGGLYFKTHAVFPEAKLSHL